MFDITIFMPGIRPNNWKNIYDSLGLACKRYKWQLLFASPFNLPDELLKYDNVSLVIDRGCPTRATQKGIMNVETDLFCLTMDDGLFLENSLDENLDFWKASCREQDLISLRYAEANTHLPVDYWRMYHHPVLRLPGISDTQMFVHPMIMSRDYFFELGGLDCQFEYLSYALHDLSIRATKNGSTIYVSQQECLDCTWFTGETGDHKPVHNAQTYHDQPLFEQMYGFVNDRKIIDYHNWRNVPHVWDRRFTKGLVNSYQELCTQEGYEV